MVAAATLHDVPVAGKAASFATLLGDASYSIYLLHPLVIRVVRILWEKIGSTSTISPWIFVGVIIVATVVGQAQADRSFELWVLPEGQPPVSLGVLNGREALVLDTAKLLGDVK